MRRSTPSSRVLTFAGIDYHKNFSVVTLGDQDGMVLRTLRTPNDRVSITAFFSQYPGLVCAIESCRGYEWFVELLKELGLTVHVANPHQVKLIAQSRCKTDKIDSRILMELLAIGFLPTCYQPTREERDLRERLRWRHHLVRSTTRIKLQIHSLLAKENLSTNKLFGERGRSYLQQVKLTSPARRQLLDDHLRLLEQLEAQVAQEDVWVRRTCKQTPAALLLTTIPGIGAFSALVIVAELGDVSRFKRSSQVVNFTGLTPSIYSSANVHRTGPITKQGSPILRWVLVQDAWQAISVSPALRLYFARVSKRCGRQGAIVSVARKLIQIAYHVLRTGQPYDEGLVGANTA